MFSPCRMVSENCLSVDLESAHQETPPLEAGMSCIATQNVQLPACVGVPLINPLDANVRPGGSAPVAEKETYGTQPVPSRPLSCTEYDFPVEPCGQTLMSVPVPTGQMSSWNASALAAGTTTPAMAAARTKSSSRRVRRMRLLFGMASSCYRPRNRRRL